jgi:hypothetical protein
MGLVMLACFKLWMFSDMGPTVPLRHDNIFGERNYQMFLIYSLSRDSRYEGWWC